MDKVAQEQRSLRRLFVVSAVSLVAAFGNLLAAGLHVAGLSQALQDLQALQARVAAIEAGPKAQPPARPAPPLPTQPTPRKTE